MYNIYFNINIIILMLIILVGMYVYIHTKNYSNFNNIQIIW